MDEARHSRRERHVPPIRAQGPGSHVEITRLRRKDLGGDSGYHIVKKGGEVLHEEQETAVLREGLGVIPRADETVGPRAPVEEKDVIRRDASPAALAGDDVSGAA